MKKLSRRRFLALSVAAGPVSPRLVTAAVGLLFPAVGLPAAGANETIRVGLVGAGVRGRRDLEVFLANPDVECPVICDVDDWMLSEGVRFFERTRRKAPATVKDFRRVLERNDVDAVLVATPDHWHALVTIYACQAGKDVYVESPLATTVAEGRAMIIAAQRYRRVVQVGTQRRSAAHWQEAVEFVRSGKLGRVTLARGWAYDDDAVDLGNPPDCDPPGSVDYDLWLGPAPRRPFNPNRFHGNFRWFWDYAGGLLTFRGAHLMDIVLWTLGPDAPQTVHSTGGKFLRADNTETPDTQIASYRFPAYALLWEHQAGSGIGPNYRPAGVSFTGDAGTLIVDDNGWEILPGKKQNTVEPRKSAAAADPLPAHVRDFLDCVRSRRPPAAALESGHLASTVAHLGNAAFRSGRAIAWDAAAEKVLGDEEANRYVSAMYRKPWLLPYGRRG